MTTTPTDGRAVAIDRGTRVPQARGVARRAPRSAPAWVLPAVLGAACVAVATFWWTTTPAVLAATPGGALTGVGDLAGLLTSVLVLAQLLLVGRVPWFERAAGLDRLVAWHRVLGTTVLLLLVTHVVLVVVGAGMSAHETVWAQAWSMLWTTPDLLTATIGGGVFVLVGLTSARLARERLSYEVWFVVHLTVYVGVYLTFAHQLSAGGGLGGSPTARFVWTTMYVATAAALVLWRVLLPLADLRRHGLRVEAVVPEADGLTSVWVRGRGVDALRARGGQFFLVRFVTRGHHVSAHPYSLSMVPAGDRLRFTVGALGDHSTGVTHLRPGTRVLLEGPFGRFTAERARSNGVLLVAGGAGIGPVRALAEDLLTDGHDVVVLHRARTAEALALGGELAGAVRYVPLTGRRADLGHDPLDPASVRALVPDVRDRDVFVCGPGGMVTAVVATARTLGVPRSKIHHEELSLS